MIQLGANLLSSLATSDMEISQTLVTGAGVCLERIVSFGQASPEGFWYDQTKAEWVTVLTGRARIRVADQANDITLGPGDTVLLPAHCRHRVEWTDPDQPTIWLALFVDGELRPA
ncbi:MAG: cupin domain-containing protein [Hyphomicrobiaceae bacterium]